MIVPRNMPFVLEKNTGEWRTIMNKNKHERMPNTEPLPKPAPIITDPQGCYTGRPIEKYETPVQDADDL